MSWDGIVVGDYGQTGRLTVNDIDEGTAANISGYTNTIQMIFTDPSGNETTKTASFTTDGSDGVVEYTIESGLIDEAGVWQVRAKVQSATAVLTSEQHRFYVSS